MLDCRLRPLIDPPLSRLALPLARRGVPAGLVTVAGLGTGLLAACAAGFGCFNTALGLFLFSRLLDGLDGHVARLRGPTGLGGHFDLLADFTIYAALPLGLAVAMPDAALAAAGLLASFYINAASFFGTAILAERRQMQSSANGPKSHYHPRGLIEGTETIAFFAVCLLVPGWFTTLAPIFALLTLWTAASRIPVAWRLERGEG